MLKKNQYSKNHLLSIGIDNYMHLPKLYNAVKDAREVADILIEKYQFQIENIQTIYNHQATKEAIIDEFKILVKRVQPEDNVIIYFSGHGEYDKIFNEGYWMPVNAESNNDATSIPNSFIKKMLNAINCHHLFVVVDSCFSGTLFSRGAGRVAQRLEQEPSRWGLTSGRAEIVEDGKAGDNSPFAESFLYILKNNNKPLGVAELCRKVVEVTASNANQTPLGEPLNLAGHEGGQFVFHPKADEATEWANYVSQNTILGFQSYLNKYPNGKYIATAKNHIQNLTASEEWLSIKQLPEKTSHSISKKIMAINNFIKKYPKFPPYNKALALGEILEYKGEFIEVKNSIFKLRQFARKQSPFQNEAKRLIKQYEQTGILSSKKNPLKIEDTYSLQSIASPTYEYQQPTKKQWKFSTAKWATGLSVIALLLLTIYFLIPDKSFIVSLNKNTVELIFEDGTPPYQINILKNDELIISETQLTKGIFPTAKYTREIGIYRFVVMDAKERIWNSGPISMVPRE